MYLKPNTHYSAAKAPKKRQTYTGIIFMGLVLLFMNYSPCHAKEFFNYHGVTGFHGQSKWTNIGPASEDDYEWSNISYLLGKDLNPWLSFETLLGPGYIKTQNFNETGSIEWRLLLHLHGKYLYLKLGTGVAYLFDSKNMPDLSNANFFSIISYSMGFRFRFNDSQKNSPEIMLGYSVEHLSDPFKGGEDGDIGLNIGSIYAVISWYF